MIEVLLQLDYRDYSHIERNKKTPTTKEQNPVLVG